MIVIEYKYKYNFKNLKFCEHHTEKYFVQIIIFLTFLFPSLASSDNSAFTEADFVRSIQVKLWGEKDISS